MTAVRQPKTKFMRDQEAAMAALPTPLSTTQREGYGKLLLRSHLLRKEVPRMLEHAAQAEDDGARQLVLAYHDALDKLYRLANAALLTDEEGR